MSAPVTAALTGPWPADVLEFAVKHNVQACLDPLLEATWRVFPTARRIQVSLQDDPGILDDWHIDFDVEVPAADVLPQFVETVHRWNREMYRCCPAPLVFIFRLGVGLVS